MNCGKATCLDGIGAKALKLCGYYIVLPLTSIINNSIYTFIYIFKDAHFVPVYKHSNEQGLNNYRPISNYIKIIEKNIAAHI